jgi:hypothetical protein
LILREEKSFFDSEEEEEEEEEDDWEEDVEDIGLGISTEEGGEEEKVNECRSFRPETKKNQEEQTRVVEAQMPHSPCSHASDWLITHFLSVFPFAV